MILLDTHAWIWWVDRSSSLSPKASQTLRNVNEDRPALVSSISVWEFHMLIKRGRLTLKMDPGYWIRQCELSKKIRFVPVDNEIARISIYLPHEAPEDPADRMVMATAISLGAVLVSKDAKIRQCRGVQVVW